MKLAAIDIGSNAVRLLLCQVIETNPKPVFKKIELVRVPIRLGEDAFTEQKVSLNKIERLVKTMKAFKLLIDVFPKFPKSVSGAPSILYRATKSVDGNGDGKNVRFSGRTSLKIRMAATIFPQFCTCTEVI
jgi:hypothetical protein